MFATTTLVVSTKKYALATVPLRSRMLLIVDIKDSYHHHWPCYVCRKWWHCLRQIMVSRTLLYRIGPLWKTHQKVKQLCELPLKKYFVTYLIRNQQTKERIHIQQRVGIRTRRDIHLHCIQISALIYVLGYRNSHRSRAPCSQIKQ